ncbi:MAG: BREX-1 system adenine-specific DNA-methyltransferase PglX [Candidatus Gastranaerophilaceae bacterium]
MESVLENEKTLDKAALRDFAVNARRKLKERVELQAKLMGFFEDNREVKYEFEDDKSFKVNGETFSKKQAEVLRKQIKDKGYETIIDEVAYTWFNRFIALYYMEVNGYSENNCNIISNLSNISQYAVSISVFLNDSEKQTIMENITNSKDEPIFKTLILHQCNVMNKKLPFLFEEIEDYTELLFPSGLLTTDSMINDMKSIDESNWKEVEIIGWLYQYYNQAEKDRVIQAKKRYKVNEIPYATQLFTPKWIVKYMTQNSLGRLWQEAHSTSNLKDSMEFYLEPRNLTEEDRQELESHIMKGIQPEQIKVFDPACGSGHILVYAYSLLYEMYKESGYIESDIPSLILKNNLFGLDICKRASQLAQLAVLLRARQDDKNIFDKYDELNIRCIENSQEFSNDEIAFVADENQGESFNKIQELIECFKYANIYGSLSKYPHVDFEFYNNKLIALKNKYSSNILVNSELIYNKFEPLVKQFKILKQQYECVITNPPYMGNKYMESKLAEFVAQYYPTNKSDLFSAFMEYIPNKVNKSGQIGLVTPFVWMFIKSYEELRNQVINKSTLSSIIQLEYNAFEAACVPVATFTLRNYSCKYPAECIKLSDFTGSENQPIKTLEAIANPNIDYRYQTYSMNFHLIPGSPIAYWASDGLRRAFLDGNLLKTGAKTTKGLITGDNNRFLRLWQEVNILNIAFNINSIKDIENENRKWFPCNKGGECRKWYGNNEYLINYFNNGKELIKQAKLEKRNAQDYDSQLKFKPCVSWSSITSGLKSFRYKNMDLVEHAGMAFFPTKSDKVFNYLGLMNSIIGTEYLKILSPTLNINAGEIDNVPILEQIFNKQEIEIIVRKNIEISKDDWDSFEISWDFKIHPLLRFSNFTKGAVDYKNINEVEPITSEGFKIKSCFERWKAYKQEQYDKLKANEEELNRIFIEIYGLQDEMKPNVSDDDLSYFRKADEKREIKSLLSYAVGCMFGRYSLDEEGLAFAGGTFDCHKYNKLEVDEDGILPILSGTWFEDDIIEELKRFLKAAFGEMYLPENMEYIADTLGRNGGESAESTIRNYFLKDFYKDHLQVYKKRPIYWMFTSGKEKAFNCLVYLHRYDKTTLSRIRKDYLHEYQAKLDRAIAQAEDESNVKLTSLYAKYKTELLEFDAKIKDLADSQIELDLDDGVKVNYAKFKGLLEAEKDVVGRGK